MDTPPQHLWRVLNGNAFVGAANGSLWLLSPTSMPRKLNLSLTRKVSQIVWPDESRTRGDLVPQASGMTYENVVVAVDDGAGQQNFISINIASQTVTQLPKPIANARVVTISPSTGSTVYSIDDLTGLGVWVGQSPGSKPNKIFEGNSSLPGINFGIEKRIEYETSDGKHLGGWILLPPFYKPGTKYPLIVWPYPGWMAGRTASWIDDQGIVSAINLQIAAAHGYAVLRPSIPLNPLGVPDEPLLKMTQGVLPAVDKTIELGIADPEQVFVMGVSLGGYATYALITQTDRFNAAVAMAGLSDLISGYGQFDTVTRYDERPHENQFSQSRVIEASLRLGAPPWKDLPRYLRNSPILYADRVRTPLLIVHGDLDAVPIQQGEEFFKALYRQGKPAEFVRYWGEGHIIESPDNVRDMWSRVFAWFDEFSHRHNDRSAK